MNAVILPLLCLCTRRRVRHMGLGLGWGEGWRRGTAEGEGYLKTTGGDRPTKHTPTLPVEFWA